MVGTSWYIDKSGVGTRSWDYSSRGYGDGCVPAVGDYDGDGKDDISAVRCAGSDFWFIDYSGTDGTAWSIKSPGRVGPADIAVPANYDGDPGDEMAVVTATEWRIDVASQELATWNEIIPLPAE